ERPAREGTAPRPRLHHALPGRGVVRGRRGQEDHRGRGAREPRAGGEPHPRPRDPRPPRELRGLRRDQGGAGAGGGGTPSPAARPLARAPGQRAVVAPRERGGGDLAGERRQGGHPVKRFFTWVFILLVLGGGSAWLYLRLLPPPPPPPPPGEIERLTALREALGEQFKELVVEGGEKSLERAPRGDIMIGLPTSLTRGIAEKVTTGLFGETTVRLQNLKVHKEGEVKA